MLQRGKLTLHAPELLAAAGQQHAQDEDLHQPADEDDQHARLAETRRHRHHHAVFSSCEERTKLPWKPNGTAWGRAITATGGAATSPPSSTHSSERPASASSTSVSSHTSSSPVALLLVTGTSSPANCPAVISGLD